MSEQAAYDHGREDDSTMDEIDALLAGEPAKETEQPEKVEAVEPEETQEPEEEVEQEVDEIDYDLSVPMSDGRDPMKLGEMKDAINNYERDKASVESQRMDQIRQETELNQYMRQANIAVPKEFTEYMAKQQADHLERQHQLMMKMMPELQDKSTFDQVRTNIVEVAKGSNFTEAEIANVADARIVHLLNRLSKLETEKAKAAEKVEQIKAKSTPKGLSRRNKGKVSNIDKMVDQAINSRDENVKSQAIEALLSG